MLQLWNHKSYYYKCRKLNGQKPKQMNNFWEKHEGNNWFRQWWSVVGFKSTSSNPYYIMIIFLNKNNVGNCNKLIFNSKKCFSRWNEIWTHNIANVSHLKNLKILHATFHQNLFVKAISFSEKWYLEIAPPGYTDHAKVLNCLQLFTSKQWCLEFLQNLVSDHFAEIDVVTAIDKI